MPVYGLGTYGGGRPYYAMRFIKGDSLKEAIEHFHGDATLKNDPGRRSLELRKLLRRFLDVCNAVDYAHSRGVIHRDLKPANIILGRHGETLVVDWGLAKAVGRADPSVGEQTIAPSSSGSSETMPGSALGTPAYMSPEQACGDLDRLGPRSDVYSLGATLYCLLTGKPPFEGDDVGEVLRKVQRGDFVPPRQREPSLDAALEAVCLKAMANQPGDRYPSCRALADDVERWMADEPVSAWAEPWTRKLSRWLTRHRTGVTGAAAAVLAGVVGLSAVLAVQARANLALADKNTALTAANAKIEARYNLAVEAIKTFHTGVSEDFLLKQDQIQGAARPALEIGLGLLRQARRPAGPGDRHRLAAGPGAVQLRAGRPDGQGRPQRGRPGGSSCGPGGARGAGGRAGGRRPGQGRRRPEPDRSRQPARSDGQDGRGAGDVPAVGVAAGRPGGCRSVGAGRAGGLPVANGWAAKDHGQVRRRPGGLAAGAGRPGGAGRRSRSLQRRPPRPGGHHRSHRRPADGRRASRRRRRPSTAGRWRSTRSWPTTTPPSPNSATAWRGATATSATCADPGKPAEAEAEYRKALAIWQKLADDNPAVTEFRKNLAWIINTLGFFLWTTGKPAEAEAEFRNALALLQKLADDNPAVTRIPQPPGVQPLQPRHLAV